MEPHTEQPLVAQEPPPQEHRALWPTILVYIALTPPLSMLLTWLLLLPFRLLGIAVDGVLELVRAVVLLPARVLSVGRR